MKKVFTFIFLVIAPFIVFAYLEGDVNGDNKVNNMDYVLVRNHIRKTSLLTDNSKSRADINKDNKINNMDYVLIRNIIRGTSIVTPSQIPVSLTDEEKICESVKNNSSIDYKSFISLSKKSNNSDKYKDDYYAIKAAHDCANKYNKPIVTTKATYHIYKRVSDEYIKVMTNTNLNNSTIYIHDEVITLNSSNIANYNNYIYKIENKNNCETRDIKKYNSYDNIVNLVKNELKYNYAFVYINNKKGSADDIETKAKRVFRRSGSNLNEGDARSDSFRIRNGVVSDTLFWNKSDYNSSTIKTVLVCEIPSSELLFKNAVFKTIVSTSDKFKNVSEYILRNINISRSNTKIDNIKHSYVKIDGDGTKNVSSINYKYHGFYYYSSVADVELTNSMVYGLNATANSGGNSTYDLNLSDVINMKINNVTMYDDSQLSADLWGVIGTNRSKKITFTNCKLNRIDAHRGILDLTVKDTTLGRHGLTLTGAGSSKNNTLIIERVKVLSDHYNTFIYLRGDYGSTWNGKIIIKDSELKVKDGKTRSNLIMWDASYDNTMIHNYGYDLYLPDVEVINFKVDSKSVNNFYIFNKSTTFFDSLSIDKGLTKSDVYQTHYNPTITKSNITKKDGSTLMVKDYSY